MVLGASEKTDRYANIAVKRLVANNHPVVAYGNKPGEIDGVPIITDFPVSTEDIHTVTLYLSAKNQVPFYEDLIALNPKRVIFNPGTENAVFEQLLSEHQIAFEHACTLVMLSANTY